MEPEWAIDTYHRTQPDPAPTWLISTEDFDQYADACAALNAATHRLGLEGRTVRRFQRTVFAGPVGAGTVKPYDRIVHQRDTRTTFGPQPSTQLIPDTQENRP